MCWGSVCFDIRWEEEQLPEHWFGECECQRGNEDLCPALHTVALQSENQDSSLTASLCSESCGGLRGRVCVMVCVRNVPHRLSCLNTWSPTDDTVLRDCGPFQMWVITGGSDTHLQVFPG